MFAGDTDERDAEGKTAVLQPNRLGGKDLKQQPIQRSGKCEIVRSCRFCLIYKAAAKLPDLSIQNQGRSEERIDITGPQNSDWKLSETGFQFASGIASLVFVDVVM